MVDSNLSIILPCAGEGKRLGLSYPKELYEICEGVRLVDFSLLHVKYQFNKNPELKIKIVVVIKKGKESVFEYVKKRLYPIEVVSVYFNDDYFEWAGSVYSASDHFSEYNLVLLPDSALTFGKEDLFSKENLSLLDTVYNSLMKNPAAFGIIRCDDRKKLKNLGACFVDNGVITRFKDKPKKYFDAYNSFWGCYAFKKEIAKRLYDFLVGSIKRRKTNYQDEIFYPFSSFFIDSYTDLGTWDSIENFKVSLTLQKFVRYNRV